MTTRMSNVTERQPCEESIGRPLTGDDIAVLGTAPVIQGLSAEGVRVLASYLEVISCRRELDIAREGEDGLYAFFVLKGRVQIRRKGVLLQQLGCGDHFGELAFMGLRPRSATVSALEESRLARISRESFEAMSVAHPDIALHLLQSLISSVGDQLVAVTDSMGQLLRQRSLPRRMSLNIRIDGEVRTVPTGTPLSELVGEERDGASIVAGLINNRPVSLDSQVSADCDVGVLTLVDGEGRRIYRRSIGLLLMEAARLVAPGWRLRIGPSVSFGQVVCIEAAGPEDPSEVRKAILEKMQDLIKDGEELTEELWMVEEAKSHFVQIGLPDTARLLERCCEPSVVLACCGETYAVGLGPILTVESRMCDFDLVEHPQGFLIDFGDVVRSRLRGFVSVNLNEVENELRHPRFFEPMALEHRHWLAAMGVRSVGSFNQFCVEGRVPHLIQVSEGFHEKRIGAIADLVADRRGNIRVIRIAGPSSSGKTTFINRLSVQLAIHGIRALTLGLDDYYVDRDRTPIDASGDYDFEALEAIDRVLLQRQLGALLAGEPVRRSRYNFLTGKSHPDHHEPVVLGSGDVIITEGIHGLNPTLLDGAVDASEVFSIFIHPSLDLPIDQLSVIAPTDVRLIRRIVRDRFRRGYSATDNITRWSSVRRGEQIHIYPYMNLADIVFDSSLVYELAVLKIFAERYLLEVPQSHPAHPLAVRLRRLMDQVVPIFPNHVPPTSVLREFIGGSGFEY